MKGFLIEYVPGKCMAFGKDGEGHEIRGPILYVPEEGAIFYTSNLQGDADCSSVVTCLTHSFQTSEVILRQLAKQVSGKEIERYEGEKFDLSHRVEVDVEGEEFRDIMEKARVAYLALRNCKERAMILI